jgi:hypothetical protein
MPAVRDKLQLVFGFETSVSIGVVLSRSYCRSYYWRQAQVCMSPARGSDDPVHKQQDLALEFAQSAVVGERDLDVAASLLMSAKRTLQSAQINASRLNRWRAA